jgi:drug/metabolite transporter (DMT)-like permease
VVIGLVLAVLAAIGFGTGTFIQHISAVAVECPPPHHRTRHGLLGLLGALLIQPRWLLGQALAGGGTALQFGAMAFAPVTVVQPVVAIGLPVALVLEVVRERRRPAKRLAAGVVLCVLGLVMFVLFARAGSAPQAPGWLAAAVLIGLVGAFSLLGRFAPGGRVGAAFAGLGAGGALGVATVSAAVPLHRFLAGGLTALPTHWSPYVAVAAGVLATAASQQAYARGELAWSLPALTVCNALTATFLAVLVLREPVDMGSAPLWSAGAALAVVGVLVASITHAVRRGRGHGSPPSPTGTDLG